MGLRDRDVILVNRDRVGLRDVRPNASYREFYPFQDDVVAKLAYYFHYDYADQPDPSAYLGNLVAAVEGWHAEVGTAAFLSSSQPDCVELIDTRRCASEPYVRLSGADAALYTACVHGANLGALTRSLPYSRETIADYVSRMSTEVSRIERLLRSLRSFSLYERPEVAARLADFLGGNLNGDGRRRFGGNPARIGHWRNRHRHRGR